MDIDQFLVKGKCRYYGVETSEIVAGQNLVFDYRFINKMFESEEQDKPKWPKYIDTKWMADQLVHDNKLKRSLVRHELIHHHHRLLLVMGC